MAIRSFTVGAAILLRYKILSWADKKTDRRHMSPAGHCYRMIENIRRNTNAINAPTSSRKIHPQQVLPLSEVVFSAGLLLFSC